MTYKLYPLENGFNKSAIMQHARELLASGMFDKWQITKRERWGRCLKAAWNSAKHERYSVQFKAEQARISAYLEAKRKRKAKLICIDPRHSETADKCQAHC